MAHAWIERDLGDWIQWVRPTPNGMEAITINPQATAALRKAHENGTLLGCAIIEGEFPVMTLKNGEVRHLTSEGSVWQANRDQQRNKP